MLTTSTADGLIETLEEIYPDLTDDERKRVRDFFANGKHGQLFIRCQFSNNQSRGVKYKDGAIIVGMVMKD